MDILIEKLVELKEKEMTDRKIAEYMSNQGIKISLSTVNRKLTFYYESIGEPKPRGKKIKDEELEEMKEQRKSDREIAEYFTKSGRKISITSVCQRLSKNYKSKNKIKPRGQRPMVLIKKEIQNEEIIDLRKKGMTLREISQYFLAQGRIISHTAIDSRLKRMSELGQAVSNEEKIQSKEIKEDNFRERIKVNITPTVKEEMVQNVKNDTNLGKEI